MLANDGLGIAEQVLRNDGSAAQAKLLPQCVLAGLAQAYEVVLAELGERFKAKLEVDDPAVACGDEELNVFKQLLLPEVAHGVRNFFRRKLHHVANP